MPQARYLFQGTYNNEQDKTSEGDCKLCKSGFYCPVGSTSSTEQCDAGYVCTGGAQSATPTVRTLVVLGCFEEILY